MTDYNDEARKTRVEVERDGILQAIEKLSQRLCSLHDVLSVLENRIETVCILRSEEPERESLVEENRSPIYDSIRGEAYAASRAENRILAIIDSLDI